MCLFACVLACFRACVLACLCACVLVCLRACVLVCLRACVLVLQRSTRTAACATAAWRSGACPLGHLRRLTEDSSTRMRRGLRLRLALEQHASDAVEVDLAAVVRRAS